MAQIADAIRREDQSLGCSQSFPIQDAGHLCIREFGGHLSDQFYQLRIGDITVDSFSASLDLNRRRLTSNPVHFGLDLGGILRRVDDHGLD